MPRWSLYLLPFLSSNSPPPPPPPPPAPFVISDTLLTPVLPIFFLFSAHLSYSLFSFPAFLIPLSVSHSLSSLFLFPVPCSPLYPYPSLLNRFALSLFPFSPFPVQLSSLWRGIFLSRSSALRILHLFALYPESCGGNLKNTQSYTMQ